MITSVHRPRTQGDINSNHYNVTELTGQVVWSHSHSQQLYIRSIAALPHHHMSDVTPFGVNKNSEIPSSRLTALLSSVLLYQLEAGSQVCWC